MIKALIFAGLLAIALTATAPVNNLSQTESVVTLTPGVNATAGFDQQVGSQFRIWVPSNVSNINITWQRSPAESGVCASSAYAYLYAKWGTWPCSSNAYYGLDELCDNGYSLSYSSGSVLSVTIDADSYDIPYWYYNSDYEFRRGEWLYLASYLDLDYNCTATIKIDFDGCPANTIATEGSSDTVCAPYTNVTGNTFSETFNSATSFTKFYLVHVPVNASGVRVIITKNDTNDYIYVYGRFGSGSTSSSTSYYTYNYSYYNQTVWFPNPSAGEFVVTVDSSSTDVTLTVTIQVEACTAGFGADEYGNCTYPLTSLANPSALTTPITATVPALPAGSSADCSWAFYGLNIPANTYSFINVSIDIPASSGGYVYLRKNAYPLTDVYDEYSYGSADTWNFTPEDLYVNQTTIYYIGFCNPTTSAAITFTASATVKVAPSPSPSSSPSFVPSASPSASPEPDNSGSSAVVSIVVMLLAAVVVMF